LLYEKEKYLLLLLKNSTKVHCESSEELNGREGKKLVFIRHECSAEWSIITLLLASEHSLVVFKHLVIVMLYSGTDSLLWIWLKIIFNLEKSTI
jgi:hypothetical protein